MRKRIVTLLAIVAVVALIVGCLTAFVGCNKDDAGSITVWGPEVQQETLKTMVAKFKEANPDIKLDIKVGVCGENDAYGNVSKDPDAAADVFAFANDQLVNFLTVGALAKVGGQFETDVRNNNGAAAVGFAEFNGSLYGYPYSADNTYFVYYNKSVVSAEQVKDLDTIIAACKAGNKKIAWEVGNGWYDAAWFFAFGGRYNVEYTEDFQEKSVTTTFAADSVGKPATEAMRKLADAGDTFVNSPVDSVKARVSNTGDIAVAITGSWNADTIKAGLGDNYAVAELPKVNNKQIAPFVGGKLYGVNATSKHLTEAHKLAAFLAGKEMQQLRFEKHNIIPCNKELANSAAVAADPIAQVIAKESVYGVAQMFVPQKFWDPMKGYAQWVVGKDFNAAEKSIKDHLDILNDQIGDRIEPLDEADRKIDAWYLTGGMNDWSTTVFLAENKMTKGADNKWTITKEFTLENDEDGNPKPIEFKAILHYGDDELTMFTYGGTKWADGDNQKITASGTYTITFDPDANTYTIKKQQ